MNDKATDRDRRPRRGALTLPWKLLIVFATVLAAGGLFASASVFVHADEQNHELCITNASRLIDKEHQLAQTHDYLASAVGKDRTFFNSYIRRVSLPRLVVEIVSDRKVLPRSCHDEYQALKRR